jgi:hypothetical protein
MHPRLIESAAATLLEIDDSAAVGAKFDLVASPDPPASPPPGGTIAGRPAAHVAADRGLIGAPLDPLRTGVDRAGEHGPPLPRQGRDLRVKG